MDKQKDFEKGWEEHKAKKKQEIEEMARTLIKASCKGSECEKCIYIDSVKEAEESCVCLKALYNAGYRKIPENAVVLTREELEDMKFTKEHCDLYQENKWLRDCIGLARKETAEKFAERLKEKLEENSPVAGYDLEDLEFDGVTIQECINEIAKEMEAIYAKYG